MNPQTRGFTLGVRIFMLDRARNLLERTGGFTMSIEGVRQIVNPRNVDVDYFHGSDMGGFAIGATQEDWLVIEPHQIDDDETFYNIVLRLYEDFPQCALGAWLRPDGFLVFDPVVIERDFNKACEIAQENKQEAIWDFRMQETVYMEDE